MTDLERAQQYYDNDNGENKYPAFCAGCDYPLKDDSQEFCKNCMEEYEIFEDGI